MFAPSDGQNFASAEVSIAVAAWCALLAGHIGGSYLTTITSLWRRLPVPVLATGMAGCFLLVQLLMPDGGGAFIYFQF
jgi:hypothetical protein